MGNYLEMSAVSCATRIGKNREECSEVPGGRQTYGQIQGSFLHPGPSPAPSVEMVFVPTCSVGCEVGGSGQGEHVMWGLGTLFAELLPKWPKEDRFTLENSLLILLLCCSLKKKR